MLAAQPGSRIPPRSTRHRQLPNQNPAVIWNIVSNPLRSGDAPPADGSAPAKPDARRGQHAEPQSTPKERSGGRARYTSTPTRRTETDAQSDAQACAGSGRSTRRFAVEDSSARRRNEAAGQRKQTGRCGNEARGGAGARASGQSKNRTVRSHQGKRPHLRRLAQAATGAGDFRPARGLYRARAAVPAWIA